MDTREFAPEDEDLRGVGRACFVLPPIAKSAKLCACGCGRRINPGPRGKRFFDRRCAVRWHQRAAKKRWPMCELCRKHRHGENLVLADGTSAFVCRRCVFVEPLADLVRQTLKQERYALRP